jgi:hypothetical protein
VTQKGDGRFSFISDKKEKSRGKLFFCVCFWDQSTEGDKKYSVVSTKAIWEVRKGERRKDCSEKENLMSSSIP